MLKRIWNWFFGGIRADRLAAIEEARRRRDLKRERLIREFMAGKPSVLDAGAADELYNILVEKYDLSLLGHANAVLMDYFGAVLFEVMVRSFKQREEVPTERWAGGMDVIETLLDLLRDLRTEQEIKSSKG